MVSYMPFSSSFVGLQQFPADTDPASADAAATIAALNKSGQKPGYCFFVFLLLLVTASTVGQVKCAVYYEQSV